MIFFALMIFFAGFLLGAMIVFINRNAHTTKFTKRIAANLYLRDLATYLKTAGFGFTVTAWCIKQGLENTDGYSNSLSDVLQISKTEAQALLFTLNVENSALLVKQLIASKPKI